MPVDLELASNCGNIEKELSMCIPNVPIKITKYDIGRRSSDGSVRIAIGIREKFLDNLVQSLIFHGIKLNVSE